MINIRFIQPISKRKRPGRRKSGGKPSPRNVRTLRTEAPERPHRTVRLRHAARRSGEESLPYRPASDRPNPPDKTSHRNKAIPNFAGPQTAAKYLCEKFAYFVSYLARKNEIPIERARLALRRRTSWHRRDRHARIDRQPNAVGTGRHAVRRVTERPPRRKPIHSGTVPSGRTRLSDRLAGRCESLPAGGIRPLRRLARSAAKAGRRSPDQPERNGRRHHGKQRQDRRERMDRPALSAADQAVPQSEKLQLADRRRAVAANGRAGRPDRADRGGYLAAGRNGAARTDDPPRSGHRHEHRRRASGKFRLAPAEGRREANAVRAYADDRLQRGRPAARPPRPGTLR